MRDEPNISAVASLQPDFMGFIFYDKSPRYVGEDFSPPSIDEEIQKTGVFANQPLGFVMQECDRCNLDAVQLHGHEQPDYCQSIKLKGITVIKVFHLDESFDFKSTKDYQYKADYFLFDAKGKNLGGNGTAFDWALLEKYNYPTPFFLSGGLSQENISSISKLKNPNLFGLDFNSGVEDSPGIKDIKKIKRVIEALKQMNRYE